MIRDLVVIGVACRSCLCGRDECEERAALGRGTAELRLWMESSS